MKEIWYLFIQRYTTDLLHLTTPEMLEAFFWYATDSIKRCDEFMLGKGFTVPVTGIGKLNIPD